MNNSSYISTLAGPGKGDCHCKCCERHGKAKYIAITGGPGGGKTAVLNMIKETCCHHTEILQESAGILFGGGFPRRDHIAAQKAAQRAIYYTQVELERLVDEEGQIVLALCDRGTLDALAYWPGEEKHFFEEVGNGKEELLKRYDMVIHLRTPPPDKYNQSNPLRIESAQQAFQLDAKIESAWDGHPRRHFVESTDNFLDKATNTLKLIFSELPECCRPEVKF